MQIKRLKKDKLKKEEFIGLNKQRLTVNRTGPFFRRKEKVMEDTIIRTAKLEDAKEILDIYAYYVEHTAITFEYAVPSLARFQQRMKNIMQRYPYIVVERDGKIQGYAYAGPFKARDAYDWSCETTIYLAFSAQKCGLGRKLYEELEQRLYDMGILNLYACIGYPNVDDEYLTKNSAQFHAHLGFKKAGTFHQCGYKFGHWYDMIWMEKMIGEHEKEQPNVKFYDLI